MVSHGRGRIFRRADGKYLIYLPLDMCTDSMFPWDITGERSSVRVKVSFDPHSGEKKLVVEELPKEEEKEQE